MPDPNLTVARDTIRTLCEKFDIACMVLLCSPSHCNHLLHLSASWSVANLDGNQLRIRAKRADFESVEAQKKAIENTTGMIAGFRDALQIQLENCNQILAVLGKHFDFSHVSQAEPGTTAVKIKVEAGSPPENCRLIAHATGDGWYLAVQDTTGNDIAILKWPFLEERLTASKLQDHGFQIV